MHDTVSVRMLGPADALLVESANEEVFDGPVDPLLGAEFLADPRHHLAGAVVEGGLVGFASAVHYVHPDKPAELWINEVGVAAAYQRRGVGRRLIEALLARGRELGCREAWVLTERENQAARALYRSAGGGEESVVYVTFAIDR